MPGGADGRLTARKPFADQVEVDLLFDLAVRQVVEQLWFDVAHHSELVEEQEDDFEQYQPFDSSAGSLQASSRP